LNQSPDFFAGFFLVRTRSTLLAACRHALSGQVGEAYVVLRVCLENALYGLYISGDHQRQQTWLRRHDDETSMNKVKREFTVANVMAHLEAIDKRSAEIAQKLYDTSIDYGGHPNERSITSQVTITSDDNSHNFSASLFSTGDLRHALCLKSTARFGVCCLDIFGHVFRTRYQLLSVDSSLDELRRGL
jgi:hypothetical protein